MNVAVARIQGSIGRNRLVTDQTRCGRVRPGWARTADHCAPSATVAPESGDVSGGARDQKDPLLARFDRNDAPLQWVGLPPIRRSHDGDGEERVSDGGPSRAGGRPAAVAALPVGEHRCLVMPTSARLTTFRSGSTPPAGTSIGDNWWINGRNRRSRRSTQSTPMRRRKKLPEPPATIGAILSSLGKPKRSAQFVAPRTAPPAPAATTEPAHRRSRSTSPPSVRSSRSTAPA